MTVSISFNFLVFLTLSPTVSEEINLCNLNGGYEQVVNVSGEYEKLPLHDFGKSRHLIVLIITLIKTDSVHDLNEFEEPVYS